MTKPPQDPEGHNTDGFQMTAVKLTFAAYSALTIVVVRPRLTFSRKSRQGAPVFTHPLHHPANATPFPAKSAQEPIESLVFL
jgi:hypothetical protein